MCERQTGKELRSIVGNKEARSGGDEGQISLKLLVGLEMREVPCWNGTKEIRLRELLPLKKLKNEIRTILNVRPVL